MIPSRAVVLLSGGSTRRPRWRGRSGAGSRRRRSASTTGSGIASRLARAAAVAGAPRRPHRVVTVDLRAIGGSALTDDAMAVPKDRERDEHGARGAEHLRPARNTILLGWRSAWPSHRRDRARDRRERDRLSGYPDCARRSCARSSARRAGHDGRAERGARFEVLAPLLELRRPRSSGSPSRVGAPLELTWSCYDPRPGELACGRCRTAAASA